MQPEWNGNIQSTIAELKGGVPYFREIGVEHDVISNNDFECAFIEIEFLEGRHPNPNE